MTKPRAARSLGRSAVATVGSSLTAGLVVLAMLITLAGPASADDYGPARRAAEARAAHAAHAADAIAASIAGLTTALAHASRDLRATQVRLPVARAELAAAKAELEGAQREAILDAARLKDAKAQEAAISSTIGADDSRGAKADLAVGQLARQAYKGETAATSMSVVVGAKSSADFVRDYEVVATALRIQTEAVAEAERISAVDRNNRARLTAVKDRVVVLKADADRRVVEAAAARAVAAARQAEIVNLIARQSAQQRRVTVMRARAVAAQVRINAERRAIGRELARILAAQAAAVAAQQRASRASNSCVAVSPSAGASASGAGLPTSIGPFGAQQVINATQVVIATGDLGLDVRGQVIAVMTAIGESTLINVDYGDVAGPDSRGLFQQRANGAWGSYSDRMNPRIAATNFGKALLRVPGWESMSPTLAAHAVQGNADPYHYAPYWGDAVLVVGTLRGDPNLARSLPATGGC
ncbi:hypothetical protein [Pengzhenrongella sp.]|jgi:hypothetical protein|uniref:coiled-coil domain-containing protein n=1 Tax=Pengzhenrongella sp. TaxID=2888820 RepID=UPI002F955442